VKLDLRGITFGYSREEPVLGNISFSVSSGSSVAILGPSGCGKTTLLKIMAGIISRDSAQHLSGEMLWDDKASGQEFRDRGKIGYVFQTAALLPNLTIAQNVIFPFLSTPVRKTVDDAIHLLRKVGLEKFAAFFPEQLSVGMRARVALVRTFATEPSLLLLDEPFSSLDVGWRAVVYGQWWMEMRERRPTTVLVTHDVGEAFLLASRVLLLNSNGRITQEIKCSHTRPRGPDLDSTRDYLLSIASLIDETQYQISRDALSKVQQHPS
jgi:ABC-type nitrate/sulfonate/bicarbonate transport system ATPase subunit